MQKGIKNPFCHRTDGSSWMEEQKNKITIIKKQRTIMENRCVLVIKNIPFKVNWSFNSSE